MHIISLYNNVSSAKTLSSYHLAKVLTLTNKKTAIVNFGENSIFSLICKNKKKNFFKKLDKELKIIPNISQTEFFSLCNVFPNDDFFSLKEEDFKKYFSLLFAYFKENKYETLIFDLTSTFSLSNSVILSLSDLVLIPLNMRIDNVSALCSKLLKNTNQNQKTFYFATNFDKNDQFQVSLSLSVKKMLGKSFLTNYIPHMNVSDASLLFTLQDIEKKYKVIFKELKIV